MTSILTPTRHHPVFSRFPRWHGFVHPAYQTNFLGVATPVRYDNGISNEGPDVTPPLPGFNEEYFEWIDILETVAEARDSYTFLDLGAGYGRWSVIAAKALKLISSIPCDRQFFYLVEAEPHHFQWLLAHLFDNRMHLLQTHAYEVAVTSTDGEVGFHTETDSGAGGPADWYGQAVGGDTIVKSMSLATILSPIERVDLIDCDIQGSELDVFLSSYEEVNAKVRRVHIATHSLEAHRGLAALFSNLGWERKHSYPFKSTIPTEYGPIDFNDGLESWSNPNL